MGILVVLWLIGAANNLCVMLLFRNAFAENGRGGRFYWMLTAMVSALSFLMWVMVLAAVSIELHFAHTRKESNTEAGEDNTL